MTPLTYHHVDVFSQAPYGGNSLAVVPDAHGLSPAQMLRITQELRHFESIFLEPTLDPIAVRARIFDLIEELPFAGHPIIGAAAVLHSLSGQAGARRWRVELPAKTVEVTSEPTERGYFGWLDQGAPAFLGEVERSEDWARAFSLDPSRLLPDLPLAVVSTGLPYLIIPLAPGAIEHARITRDITGALRQVGAQFAVLLDDEARELRHWNNDGLLEDVATGSAAGVVGAYLLRYGRIASGETLILQQGRFLGRPSRLHVRPEGMPEAVRRVFVGGDVALVGQGTLTALP